MGPLLSTTHGDTLLLDTPEEWVGRSVADVVGFRTSLVRGTRRFSVTEAESPNRYITDLQEIALSTDSVEVEAEFRRPPRGNLLLSDSSPPYGPSAPIERVELDVRRVDARLDRLASDTDATAQVAVDELYHRGVRVSRIQRAFSAGTLGRHGRRRFVPTRWSITAVDDILGKQNLEGVRYLPELSEFLVYRLTALGNRWIIVLLPGTYRYESIEAWYPSTFWNPNPTEIVLMGDHEGFYGRTTYASIGGCYYAARLATSEALLRLGRQAGVLVLREVHPGEILPLGVWNVREHVRAALQTAPVHLSSIAELLTVVGSTFADPPAPMVGHERAPPRGPYPAAARRFPGTERGRFLGPDRGPALSAVLVALYDRLTAALTGRGSQRRPTATAEPVRVPGRAVARGTGRLKGRAARAGAPAPAPFDGRRGAAVPFPGGSGKESRWEPSARRPRRPSRRASVKSPLR